MDKTALRYPFHGWRCDTGGQCVHIPYSDHIPDRGRLHAYPLLEWAGLAIVYFSADDSLPGWTPDLPVFDPDEWTLYDSRDWTVRVHVQEIGEALMEHISREIEQDVPIWEHKEYVEHPVLTRGDGPIAAWRQWCRQFYPDSS